MRVLYALYSANTLEFIGPMTSVLVALHIFIAVYCYFCVALGADGY